MPQPELEKVQRDIDSLREARPAQRREAAVKTAIKQFQITDQHEQKRIAARPNE